MTQAIVPTAKIVCAKWLRSRRQSAGKVFYSLELPGLKPRQEVALGNDPAQALLKREQILFRYFLSEQHRPLSLVAILDLYLHIKVLGSQDRSAAENLRTIKSLSTYISTHRSELFTAEALVFGYRNWRGPNHRLRADREISFLKKVFLWYSRMQKLNGNLGNPEDSR